MLSSLLSVPRMHSSLSYLTNTDTVNLQSDEKRKGSPESVGF